MASLSATLALVVAPVAIAYAVIAILHAVDPGRYDGAGGADNFTGALDVLAEVGLVAAIIVGVTAGAGDLGAGVFRELVVTGRSRLSLFAARIPGGLAYLAPFVITAFAIAAVVATTVSGPDAAPEASLVARYGGWLLLVYGFAFALAVGVGSVIGSRGISIGVLLGWQLAISPILLRDREARRRAPGRGARATRARPQATRVSRSSPPPQCWRSGRPSPSPRAPGEHSTERHDMNRLIALAAAAALLLLLATGCGVGSTDEGAAAKVTGDYLSALADGDYAAACAALAPAAMPDGDCPARVEASVADVPAEEISDDKNGELSLDVDGETAVATFESGATVELSRIARRGWSARRTAVAPALRAGNTQRTSSPRPRPPCASTVPPAEATMCFTIARPSPVPREPRERSAR